MRVRTFVALGLAVALGFALWDVLRGVSTLVTVYAGDAEYYGSQPFTWTVGGRPLTFTQLFQGLIELALVLLIAWWLRRRAWPA